MSISNTEDIIDSRDVIKRIEELETEREGLVGELESASGQINEDGTPCEDERNAKTVLDVWDDENGDELRSLKALADEAEGYAADWQYGESLIRDSYFGDYAMQLAEDIGAIDPKATWPANCIDWDRAASELQMDYTAVDFDGVTYWIR